MNRRDALLAGVGGAALGGGWAGALAWVARPRTPVIEVTGQEASQVVLVDAGDTRVLILVGAVEPELITRLPHRLGLFRRRIDLLLGTDVALADLPAGFRDRWHVAAVVALPAPASSLPPRADATIGTNATFTLDQEVSLACIRLPRNLGTTVSWRIEITRRGHRVALAPSLDDLSLVATSTYAAAIAPHGSLALAERKSVADAVALNANVIDRDAPAGYRAFNLTRIYQQDTARFELRNDAVRLPSWTVPASP